MSRPKGRPRSAESRAKIAKAMRLTGGRKRQVRILGDGTAEVPLLRGEVAIVDEVDVPLVAPHSWHRHTAGYAVSRFEVDGAMRTTYMHRLILNPPADRETDHVNGDRLDNRRQNLRVATSKQQRANQISRPGSRSRFRGVTAARGQAHPWAARVGPKSLGAFSTEEAAARAVDAELTRRYGVFARLNFAGDVDESR